MVSFPYFCPISSVSFFSCWSISSLVSSMRSWASCSLRSSYLFHSRLPGSGFLMPNLRICHRSSFFVVYFSFFSWAKCLCGLVVRMLHSGTEEARVRFLAGGFLCILLFHPLELWFSVISYLLLFACVFIAGFSRLFMLYCSFQVSFCYCFWFSCLYLLFCFGDTFLDIVSIFISFCSICSIP